MLSCDYCCCHGRISNDRTSRGQLDKRHTSISIFPELTFPDLAHHGQVTVRVLDPGWGQSQLVFVADSLSVLHKLLSTAPQDDNCMPQRHASCFDMRTSGELQLAACKTQWVTSPCSMTWTSWRLVPLQGGFGKDTSVAALQGAGCSCGEKVLFQTCGGLKRCSCYRQPSTPGDLIKCDDTAVDQLTVIDGGVY